MIFNPTDGRLNFRLHENELRNDYKRCTDLSRIKTSWDHFYSTTWFTDTYVLSGSILSVFVKARLLFPNCKDDPHGERFQMVRVNVDNTNRVIGIKMPYRFIARFKEEIKDLILWWWWFQNLLFICLLKIKNFFCTLFFICQFAY